jgi:hypothetical protein
MVFTIRSYCQHFNFFSFITREKSKNLVKQYTSIYLAVFIFCFYLIAIVMTLLFVKRAYLYSTGSYNVDVLYQKKIFVFLIYYMKKNNVG